MVLRGGSLCERIGGRRSQDREGTKMLIYTSRSLIRFSHGAHSRYCADIQKVKYWSNFTIRHFFAHISLSLHQNFSSLVMNFGLVTTSGIS